MIMEESDEKRPKKVSLWMSRRLGVGWFLFFATFWTFTMRVNMNVSIVCMVNHTAVQINMGVNIYDNKSAECEERNANDTGPAHRDGEFVWDRSSQATILGAYFWPYAVCQIPSGILTLKFGAYKLLGLALFLVSSCTMLIPVLSQTSYIATTVLRGLIGFVSSSNFVACQYLLSRWVPLHERSRLSSCCFLGAFMAFIICYVTSGFLCKYGFSGGWPSIFYLHGTGGLIFFVLWIVLMSDTPESARGITESEKEYIRTHIQKIDSKADSSKLQTIPWLGIFTSLPIYAMAIAMAASDWSMAFMDTYVPTYLDDIFSFDVDTIGLISAIPVIFIMPVVFLSGVSSDYIQNRFLSRCKTRKLFTAISMIIPALLMLPLGYVDCSFPTLGIALLTLSYGIRGFRFAGFYENALDIDPRYASIIYGMANTLGNISAFLTSVMVGNITKNSTREEWQLCFFISAAIEVFGALFYLIFARSNVQLSKTKNSETNEIVCLSNGCHERTKNEC